MANEQIIITQDNFGVELQVQFVDSKKKPVPILPNDIVEICFISPSLEKDYVQAYAVDELKGIWGYILNKEKTSIPNIWTTYWSLVNENQEVTAQERISYFVKPKFGGA